MYGDYLVIKYKVEGCFNGLNVICFFYYMIICINVNRYE